MNENFYNDEAEINLLDLMFYLMKRWKTLMVAILMGALLGSGVYMMKKPDPKAGLEEITEYEVDPIVQESMNLAYQYRQLYQNQLEYNENSILMALDANEVYVGELKYYISAGDDTEYISLLYQNLVNSDDILSKLKDAGNLECDKQYVKEIVTCSTNRGTDSYVNSIMEEVLGSSSYIAKAAVINYRIAFSDRADCEAMLQVVRDEVEKIDQSCMENYKNYELQKAHDGVMLSMDNNISKEQEKNISSLNSYLNTFKNLESSFTEEDFAYYQVEYLNEVDEEEEIPEEVLQPETENPVKWIVIGIFLMCVLWGGYYLVKYLLDKNVKTADELQDYYGLQILGRLELCRPEKKGLTGWLEKAERKSRGKADTVEYVAAAIDALNVEKVLLCTEQGNSELKETAAALQQQCTGVKVGNMVHVDSESLEAAKASNGVVILVGIGYTNQRELRRSLDVCRQQKIPVLGVVAVER